MTSGTTGVTSQVQTTSLPSRVQGDWAAEYAAALHRSIVAQQRKVTNEWIELGRMLTVFCEEGWWTYLPDSTQDAEPGQPQPTYDSFNKYLRNEPELSYSTCRAAMQAYGLFVEEFEVPPEELAAVDPSKFTDLNPKVVEIMEKRDAAIQDEPDDEEAHIAAQAAAKNEVMEWVYFAQDATRADIQARRNEEAGEEGWRSKTVTLNRDDLPAYIRDEFAPGIVVVNIKQGPAHRQKDTAEKE